MLGVPAYTAGQKNDETPMATAATKTRSANHAR